MLLLLATLALADTGADTGGDTGADTGGDLPETVDTAAEAERVYVHEDGGCRKGGAALLLPALLLLPRRRA